MPTSKELRERRAEIIFQQEEMVKKAHKEGRAINKEEMESWDKMDADQKELLLQAEGYERMENFSLVREEQERKEYVPNPKSASDRVTSKDQEYALRAWLLNGTDKCPEHWRHCAQKCGVDPSKGSFNLQFRTNPAKSVQHLRDMIREERGSSNTAQGVGSNGIGGVLRPTHLANEIEIALLSYGGMREACRTIRTADGGNLAWPTENDTGETGAIVSENSATTVESIAFDVKTLGATKYSSKIVQVSMELMQDSAFNVAEFVGEALGNRVGRVLNNHFTLRSSTAGGPTGLLSAANGTVSATTGTGTALLGSVAYGEILTLLHSVGSAYRRRPGCGFMFNDSTLKALRQIVDGNLRPIFQPGMAVGEPDTLFGYRYYINDDMASMGTQNNKFMVFGDFSKYVIRDVLDFNLRRLDERYAEYGQTGFVSLSRHDGRLVNAASSAPIKHLTVGSSTE